ncbi:MAG TPA: M1 family aminopeptidase [Longilinea sp.]|nr:M1 family aminopeptidase [Longilinea sp.]
MKWAAVFFLGLLLAGCLPAATISTPLPATRVTDPTIDDGTLLPSVSPTLPEVTAQPEIKKNTHYQISATLDDSLRNLQVQEQISLINPTGTTLAEIPLVVEANRYAGAFKLISITSDVGQTVTVQGLEENILTLAIQPPLATDGRMTVTLEYTLRLPPILPDKPQILGYTHRQINLADWYPFLPYYSPTGTWLVHPPAAVGENTVYPLSDFDLDLRLPDLNPALVVAASAPAEPIPQGYRYHLESARNFVWSASQQYRMSTQQAGAVTVTSYAFPATELASRAALDYTVQAVNYFSKQFNIEPRSSLSIVQSDFPDGMEFDGLYFLSERFYYGFDGSPRSYLALIAVHETAHQWWYARVGSDQAQDPWLDEALCTYSELLFYENLNPELAKWWWGFRVDSYAPADSLDATIYDFSQFLPYRNRIYLRGAQMLDALHTAMGDIDFFNALQAYAMHFNGKVATRQDFFDSFQSATKVDLLPVWPQYFSR